MVNKIIIRLIGLTLVVGLLFLAIGCGSQDARYKIQWTKTMDEFQARVVEDDAKANELAKNNDIAGLYRLVNQRKEHTKTVKGQIIKLNTSEKYQNVQILTLFYLLSLEERFEAQNNLNQAIIQGNPTDDLTKISDAYAIRTQQVGNELGIEISKAGLTLKTEETPDSSAPSSSPEK